MMIFLASLRRYFSLVWQALTAPVLEKKRWFGYLLPLLLLPLFLALQLLHWFLFLLDELLFPAYRRVRVERPLFVLGPPRSGTTHLHHVLALDESRTTFSAWECALGLSITARRLVQGVAWLDRRIGRPLERLLNYTEKRLLDSTGSVHPVSLRGPEEDFLTLMPLAQCFLLIIPFPRATWLWQTARLDSGHFPAAHRRRLLGWYRRCIQKHLYVHGPGRQFLSKNASFAGMSSSLLEEFPDARVMCCMRDPVRVIPSQLSSLRGGLTACGFTGMPEALRDQLIDLLHFYYCNLYRTLQQYPERFVVVDNSELHHNLDDTVTAAMRRLDLSVSDSFRNRLEKASSQSTGFRSSHRYSLQEFGLENEAIRARFAAAYAAFSNDDNGALNNAQGERSRVMVFSDAIPDRNGVGAYYCDLIHQLESEGWQTGFAGPEDTRRWQLRIGMPGDPTQQVWMPSASRVARQVHALAPRLIVAATPGPYGMLGLWWARKLGLPLVAGFHTDFPGVTSHYPTAWLRFVSRHYFLYADRQLFRHADMVLGNSDSMLTLASARGARRTELIGTLLPVGMLTRPAKPLRDELCHVLFAGRLAPEKNIHTLVKAAHALPDIQFTIAGDGPLFAAIRQESETLPNLVCTGWVSRDELLERMDQADLLVLPSELESFGNVALEAMARQRLVLVSPGCGILDWPALAEPLFRLNPDQTVTDAIRRIAALPAEQRQERARRGQQAALSLNRESLAHWESLLTEMLKRYP
ncbi:MAG: glycosyltransferase [Pseudohongiellaceae bacterium]